MPRIKLSLPDTFIFTTELPVRITDINYGGHLGNDALLALVHEARVRFLNHLGYSEKNIEGYGIIMADAAVVYASEVFYGALLRVDIGIGGVENSALDLYYRITDIAGKKEVARVKTNIVFFDYSRRRPVAMPELFRRKISVG
jgi:acyl-CoA thioester hydrolase